MPIFEAKGITKRWGGLVAVNDVDVQIEQGEVRGLIGPNGSGKTTFFNMITGIVLPTVGKITYKGEDVTGLMPHLIAEKGIGRTMQESELFKSMTVLENVEIGVQCNYRTRLIGTIFKGKSSREEETAIKDKAYETLEFVGISSIADEFARNLPYGIQRLVEIARALAVLPGLVLLDEPVAGMNLQEAKDTMKLISKIRNSGVTVLLVEHQMQSLMSISDYITVFNHGKKIAEGNPKEIQKNDEVIEAYLGKGI